MQVGKGGRHGDTDDDTILDSPAAYKTGQPSIGDEDEGDEANEEIVDVGDGGPDPLEV